MKKSVVLITVLAVLAAQSAQAVISIPSDGSDGAPTFSGAVQIDLGEAQTANWDEASTVPGKGIYDPDKWAVVFKYASVTIDPDTTVTFKNHPSGAPVVWLVQGSMTCSGTILLDGKRGHLPGQRFYAEAGPGGFRGGTSDQTLAAGSSGFGVGGGRGWYWGGYGAAGGSYGAFGAYSTSVDLYGNPRVLPLIGGSGGSGGGSGQASLYGGGGGGGAMLIACQDTIALYQAGGPGGIYARGGLGAGGGSGGGIRLVAENIVGDGYLRATAGGGDGPDAGHGGVGRICVEGTNVNFTGPVSPGALLIQPVDAVPLIWPDVSTPRVRLVSLGGKPLPPDPRGRFETGAFDVVLDQPGNQQLVLQTENVPTTWTVRVFWTPINGRLWPYTATYQSGTEASATWTVNVDTVSGVQAIQARAFRP